jgi:hypothetical protein
MTRMAWIVVSVITAVALGLAVALAVSLAGGEGEDEPEAGAPGFVPQLGDPGTVPPTGGAPEEFLDCMKEHGVEPPSGLQQGAPEGFEEALEACRDLLPEGADLRIGPSG